MTACQRIGQGLLLNLREESGVVYRDRDLIRYGAEQQNLVLLPYARRIGRGYLQRTHQAFMKNKWRYRNGKLFQTDFSFVVSIANDDFLMLG